MARSDDSELIRTERSEASNRGNSRSDNNRRDRTSSTVSTQLQSGAFSDGSHALRRSYNFTQHLSRWNQDQQGLEFLASSSGRQRTLSAQVQMPRHLNDQTVPLEQQFEPLTSSLSSSLSTFVPLRDPVNPPPVAANNRSTPIPTNFMYGHPVPRSRSANLIGSTNLDHLSPSVYPSSQLFSHQRQTDERFLPRPLLGSPIRIRDGPIHHSIRPSTSTAVVAATETSTAATTATPTGRLRRHATDSTEAAAAAVTNVIATASSFESADGGTSVDIGTARMASMRMRIMDQMRRHVRDQHRDLQESLPTFNTLLEPTVAIADRAPRGGTSDMLTATEDGETWDQQEDQHETSSHPLNLVSETPLTTTFAPSSRLTMDRASFNNRENASSNRRQQRTVGTTATTNTSPSYQPAFHSQPVYQLACAACVRPLCLRAMKAVMLSDHSKELYSTDMPPVGLQLVNDDRQVRHCACRIRDSACLGCGQVVGYHVTQPCAECLKDQNNGHFWMFYSSAIYHYKRKLPVGTIGSSSVGHLNTPGAMLWADVPPIGHDQQLTQQLRIEIPLVDMRSMLIRGSDLRNTSCPEINSANNLHSASQQGGSGTHFGLQGDRPPTASVDMHEWLKSPVLDMVCR